MKTTIYNIKNLENHIIEMRNMVGYSAINLFYEKASKGKTKKQIGFFFAALCSQVQSYLNECGFNVSQNDVKYGLYSEVSKILPEMVVDNFVFGNSNYTKHISDMDRILMSKFIDGVFSVIDNNPIFQGMSLTPDVRYNWIFHIENDELAGLDDIKLPERDNNYLNYIRGLPCIICGKHAPSEPHHLKQNIVSGLGEKSPDWMAMPLCSNCHHELAHNHTDLFKNYLKWIPVSMIDFLKLNYIRYKK